LLSEEELALLREAIASHRKKEDLETSLGRVLRRRDGSFELYLRIMGVVREEARRRKLSPMDAARTLAIDE